MVELVSRVLSAGPTTGKTTWVKKLTEQGVRIIDTDDVIREIAPYWFKAKAWRQKDLSPIEDAYRLLVDIAVGLYVKYELTVDADAICVTNLWGPGFRQALGKELTSGEGKLPVMFWRENSARISELSAARGDKPVPIPEETAARWLESFKKGGASATSKVVWVKDDEFLPDLITLPKSRFRKPGPQPAGDQEAQNGR